MALGKLAQEDPSFRVETDEESGQTIISGMGELHLDIIVDRMKREFKRGGQHRQASGGLPRDHPVHHRPGEASSSASPAAAASMVTSGSSSSRIVNRAKSPPRSTSSWMRNRRCVCRAPREYIPAVDKGDPGADAERRARRLSADRGESVTLARWLVSTRWTPAEMAFKIAGSMALQGRGRLNARPSAARAHHEASRWSRRKSTWVTWSVT